jgi:hypothetical protein
MTPTALPPAVTDMLFGPINPAASPSATTNAGASAPYFALDYLPARAVPTWVKNNSGPGLGCRVP